MMALASNHRINSNNRHFPMKYLVPVILSALTIAACSDRPTSTIRVLCTNHMANATISISNQVKGSCPVDIQVAAGTHVLEATQKMSEETENLYTQEIVVGSGVTQTVELGEPKKVLTLAAGKKAMAAFEQANAERIKEAKNGNATAQRELAQEYYANPIVREHRDRPAQYRYWIKKASDAGIADAQVEYGLVLEEDKNYEAAVVLFRKAADQGHAFGYSFLANAYLVGRGVPQDTEKGCQLLAEAANRGNRMAAWSLKNSRTGLLTYSCK